MIWNSSTSFVIGIILSGIAVLQSCIPKSIEVQNTMILESYKLSFKEPSGLSYSNDKDYLLTVSDRGQLYKINFDGSVIKKLPFSDKDLEGVCVSDSKIYVVKEREGELVELNSKGVLLKTYDVIGDSGNSGLEGLTYDSKRDIFYMLKEKSPGLLISYSLDKGIISSKKLTFAIDYSGIFYNKTTDKLWIVSQESHTITKCSLSGTPIKSYIIPIYSIEGVVVNDEETEAYIVSDKDNTLYKINLM
ncbi:MAG: SdiA-regulated domain-containing protein [Flavobacteriales bacterium]|nr:SdiA-regulated domain-containing protein [Flavobacteriales bacterium]